MYWGPDNAAMRNYVQMLKELHSRFGSGTLKVAVWLNSIYCRRHEVRGNVNYNC